MANSGAPRLFPWRIFYRVAFIQSFFILIALASSGLVARQVLKNQFLEQMRGRLNDALMLAIDDIATSQQPDWCKRHSQDTALQITVVKPDGQILCDSTGQTGSLADKKEIVGATTPNRVVFGRDPHRLNAAVTTTAGGPIVRMSISVDQLSETLRLFDTSFWIALAVVALILAGLVLWVARRLVFPLGRLILKTQRLISQQPEVISKDDLTHEVFDEWADLESNIDRLKRDLAAKTQSLSMEQVELDTLMGSISDAILAVDPEGGPLFFNSRFEVVFGAEELRKKGVKLWGVFREPDILGTFQAALKEGRTGATKAIPFDQKQGRRYFTLSVSPLRRHDGAIYGALGIFHDVTELKAAEQMRIDFVANVSHELRTPLTVIKGYADTLIEDQKKEGGESLEYLNSIARNSDRLMNLMNDLLDLSSLESDSIIQKDPLSTDEITQRIVTQLRGQFESKQQHVEIDTKERTVFADMPRLEQVLINLLSNANKYTPAGGKIKVGWVADGKATVLKVRDSGPGIPVEHHSRLFERFYRVDKARSREQGGTGLGLAIVKHIMQRHEGAVWVESNQGEGSTFFCRFPGVDAGSSPRE